MADGTLLLGTRRYSSWSLRGWLPVRLAKLDVTEEVIRLTGGGPDSEVARRSPSGMVPYLIHRGLHVWETLAICEYCAEIEPSLWPEGLEARTHARAISAEMHAGFRGLRSDMPMALGRDGAGRGQTEAALADIRRIETIFRQTRERFAPAGPYLFGATFTAADAMFAPVVTRLLTYRPPIASDTEAYCAAVRAHPPIEEWYALADAEPLDWRRPEIENSP